MPGAVIGDPNPLSNPMNHRNPELLDRLASEYVLGTLHGGARRRFERVLRDVPAARLAVAAWERRLGQLSISVPSIAPPPRLWAAIEKATGASRTEARASWWSGWLKPALGFVFGVAATVGLVQLSPQRFVTLDGLAQREQALPQSYVGLLTNAEGQPTVLVSSTRHGRKVTVKFLRPVELPAGKVLQIWALPKEGAAIPLGVTGVAKPPGKTEFEMSDTSEKLLAQIPRLAASFEDKPAAAGATPAATPADFVLSGFCVKLW
jgi:anti-sigma-K factor RskA